MTIILDPDLPIIDTHHHLWRRPDSVYGADEFLADVRSGHNIVASVAIEAQTVGTSPLAALDETAHAREAAEQYGASGLCAAIVAYVDLSADGVEGALEAQVSASGGRLRGIRQKAAWHPSPFIHEPRLNARLDLLESKTFLEQFAALQRHSLHFEAWVYHPQLSSVGKLAKRFPATTIVLEHAGSPLVRLARTRGDRREIMSQWSGHLRALTLYPNIVLKISGLGMPIFTPSGGPDDAIWGEVIETSLEVFGPARCIFGSNFPVDRQAANYAELWNIYKRLTAHLAPHEKREIFEENARSVYRI